MDWVILGSVVIPGVALLWAMLGNPNLLNFRKTKKKINKSANREVVDVSRDELENAVAELLKANKLFECDLVIGIQPSGTLLAEMVARKIQKPLGHLIRQYKDTDTKPFYIFNSALPTRSKRISDRLMAIPDLTDPPRHALIVDAVTTFGNSLAATEQKLLEEYPNCKTSFFVYAVDETRLSAAEPEVFERLWSFKKINNYLVWLRFPWEAKHS